MGRRSGSGLGRLVGSSIVLLLGLGVLGGAVATLRIQQPLDPGVPNWVITLVLASFGFVGLISGIHGVRLWMRLRGARLRRAAHRSEPWLWDHRWDPGGVHDSVTRKKLATGLMRSAFFVMFLAPFNWWAFLSDVRHPVPIVAVGLIDLAAGIAVLDALRDAARALRHGRSRLLFNRFPFRLGESVSVQLVRSRALSRCRTFECRLRYVNAGSAGGENKPVWESSTTIEAPTGPSPVPIELPLPDEGASTRLSRRWPRYWELEIRAARRGIDYRTAFRIPVY